jgi:hypothetical protein
MRRLAAAVLVLAAVGACAVLLLTQGGTGCSRTHPPEAAPAPVVMGDLLAGDWQGQWKSTSCPMSGALHCGVRKQPDGTYAADFHANYAAVMSHDSAVTLTVQKKGDTWDFEGRKDLGLLAGGMYTYKGHVTATEFFATYDSSFDKGEFRMTRAATTSKPATQPATAPVSAAQ